MMFAVTIKEQPDWDCFAKKDNGDSKEGRGRYLKEQGVQYPWYISMVSKAGLMIVTGFSHNPVADLFVMTRQAQSQPEH